MRKSTPRVGDFRSRSIGQLLGGRGGQIATGKLLNYRDKTNRQACRLYLSMMDHMQLRPSRFCDASERPDEVWRLIARAMFGSFSA